MTAERKRRVILAITGSALVLLAAVVASRLVASRTQPWSGFIYAPGRNQSMPPRVAFTPGAILAVSDGGPAYLAGLRTGDVLIAVNGVPVGNWKALSRLDDTLTLGQQMTYVVAREGGAPAEVHLRLASPLHAVQMRFTVASSMVVAVIFWLIGAFVYWRKPQDPRALVFYLLSAAACVIWLLWPLLALEQWPTRGARSVQDLNGSQFSLYVAGAVATSLGQVFLLHLALIFPKRRAALRKRQTLLWVYCAPLVQFVGIPGFLLMSVRKSLREAIIAALALAVIAATLYLARGARASGWKTAIVMRPLATIAILVLTVVAGVNALVLLVRSPASQLTITWTFGAVSFGLVYLLLFATYSVLSIVSLYRSYRDCGIEEKKQVRWPLWGMIVSAAGVLLLVAVLEMLPHLGMSRQRPSLLLTESAEKLLYLLIPLSFAFAILKYRLMEVDLVIRKTVIYSIVSGAVVAIYFGLVAGIGGLLVSHWDFHSTWLIVSATLVTAAVFVPLRNRVQKAVDARFFRARADLPRALRALSAKTSETTELFPLLKVIAEHVVAALRVRNTVIFRKSLRQQVFEPAAAVGTTGAAVEQVRFVRHTRLLAPADVSFEPPQDLMDVEKAALRQLGAALIVPVRHKGEAIGFISVGPKLSEEPFEPDEIEFLGAVAHQTAAAIYNLRLQKQEQEYAEANELQRGLLPKNIPTLPGVEISARWRPARIVSGDYFDVVKFNETSFAVCIADVAGKGMPAALLMSNLQAIVRALASETVAPAELVEKINRIMRRNLNDSKFITLFYGAVDLREGVIRYTNAGHNPPLLARSSGEEIELDQGGVIVGAFDSPAYAQGEVVLQAGDRIVLYTDGVSEARDQQGSEFGPHRLRQILRQNLRFAAGEIQERILEEVDRFDSGDLEDDATVVVIAIERLAAPAAFQASRAAVKSAL